MKLLFISCLLLASTLAQTAQITRSEQAVAATSQRGDEAQKLADAMGASLDMSGAQRATVDWNNQQKAYEVVKGAVYQDVESANANVQKLKDETAKLDSVKDKKNVEDSKLEQTAVNYLAMQMIKERKSTKDMAGERDEALVYVPKLKKHHEEQMESLKEAAVQEAQQLQDRIKEEQSRRTQEVNQKIQEYDGLSTKMDNSIAEEKGRTANAQKEGQDNVDKARQEAEGDRNQLLDQINKLNAQNAADLAAKEDKIKGLETKVEETRNTGQEAVANEKSKGEADKKTLEQELTQKMNEAEDASKQQLAGVNGNLDTAQNEINELQEKIVETNSANSAELTEAQRSADAKVNGVIDEYKQKMADQETQMTQDKNEHLQQIKEGSDSKIQGIEQNAQTRIGNLKQQQADLTARLEAKAQRLEDSLTQEGKQVDDLNAEKRLLETKNRDLKQLIQDQKEAADQANKVFSQNSNSFNSPTSSNQQSSTANTVLQNESAVATAQFAPINLKFASALVGVNLLLGCVAYSYYSSGKKLQSFQASFLEEF